MNLLANQIGSVVFTRLWRSARTQKRTSSGGPAQALDAASGALLRHFYTCKPGNETTVVASGL